ncbi:hypothetical protein [Mumia sp. DW29H23]|uniref:hypothetical protein n=1 Tax=Mumia sp. DW29H23 TaxID=3421241 RepID=UPI003D68A8CA
MAGILATWIREYLDDNEVSLLPSAPEVEVRRNTWSYGVGLEQPSSRQELVDSIAFVVTGLSTRWAGSDVHAQFYAWYDPQAGQLRCSVTSQGNLPFSGRIRITEDLDEVIAEVLEDASPGVISWGDEAALVHEDDIDHEPQPVPVWATAVT